MLDKDAKILIVDDVKLLRRTLKLMLNSIGYQKLVEASDGNEAIDKVKTEDIDLVFMDLVMPNKDGYEALTGIRSINDKVPVVMLTSISEDAVLQQCMDAGALAYINKPITQDNGPAKLENILNELN